MHYQCLIVDDEIELAKVTCEYFNLFDIKTAYVINAKECEEFLSENKVDMLLLDINLQSESGFVLCKKLRETLDIPILFISARQNDEDVLVALNIGGDDYIKKPYTLSVLLAKVKIVLKRMVGQSIEESCHETCDNEKIELKTGITLDYNTMRVNLHGKVVSLKAKEFKLFSYLFENANTIITKDTLFAAVWGDSFYSDGTLNVHIRKLREKLEENPNEPKMIKTIWGTGYLLEL